MEAELGMGTRMRMKKQGKPDWRVPDQGKPDNGLSGRVGIALPALCVLWCAAGAAGAHVQAQAVYGELDSFTGERMDIVGSGDSARAVTSVTWITDQMYYDTDKKQYGYYAGDEDIYATVADGMVVRSKVEIQIPDSVACVLYRNGHSGEFTGGTIEEPGSYTLGITQDGNTVNLFSWTIVTGMTNEVLNYTMPSGFEITAATRDGEVTDWSLEYVDMSAEGRYIISYECVRTGIPYTLDLTVDRTPPVLAIEGVDEDGKARGPVAVAKTDENDTLTITKDGEEYNTTLTRVLTQSGRYVATVTDIAGNRTEYPFTIMIYLDRNGVIFLILFLLVAAAVGALFVYFKKHQRAR